MKMFVVEGIVNASSPNAIYLNPAVPLAGSSDLVNGVIGLNRRAESNTTSVYTELLNQKNNNTATGFSLLLTDDSRTSEITLGDFPQSYIKEGH